MIWAWLAPLPMIAWVAWRTATDGFRWESLLFFVLAPALAWTSDRTRRLFWGLFPFALLALAYDGMRFVVGAGVTPGRVHVCDLRALDARWFGANGATVHDWFQAHHSPILDAICAIPYGTFIEVALGFAVYLYVKDYAAMKRFGWALLLVNLAGFFTYRLYPAAPPWYFHAHGCAVDLSARASEGPALARVDAWLGVPYFHAFYARSSNVFGAVPSLHVAYPLLVLVFGWPYFRAPGRVLASLFFASMAFAAVYLDHHWVIDVVLGAAYALVVHRLVTRPRHGHGAARARERIRPTDRRSRLAFALATWFGCGYTPYAPGTAGTLGAIPLYLALRPLGPWAVLGAAVAATVVGVWAASVVCATTGDVDPQIVVIDEVAGVLFTLAVAPPTVLATVAGFVAFRLFDMLKPWPAYVAEQRLPGGWGVMMDDVLAGAWGAGTIALLAGMGAL